MKKLTRDERRSLIIARGSMHTMFILDEIEDQGYSIENSYVRNIFDSAVDFSEIASRKELCEYIKDSLDLLPNSVLQGDVQ